MNLRSHQFANSPIQNAPITVSIQGVVKAAGTSVDPFATFHVDAISRKSAIFIDDAEPICLAFSQYSDGGWCHEPHRDCRPDVHILSNDCPG